MRRFRFAYLLASLALVAFVRPFFADDLLGMAVAEVLLVFTLLSGAYAAIASRSSFIALASLGVVSSAAWVWLLLGETHTKALTYLGTALLFYGSVTWMLMRKLFGRQETVSWDTIFQAICVYLLMGMLGAVAYALLELTSRGSFLFNGEPLPSSEEDFHGFDRFIGFSFTTLTTLGYGNVAPANARADALTTLQAVTGQLYVAIIIARLVAVEVSQAIRSAEN